MTYLRTVPSGLDHEAFQPPRYGSLVPLRRPAPVRSRTPLVGAVLFATLGLVVALPRCGRQAVEARRARHHLIQPDDHLLRDIGLAAILRQTHKGGLP